MLVNHALFQVGPLLVAARGGHQRGAARHARSLLEVAAYVVTQATYLYILL